MSNTMIQLIYQRKIDVVFYCKYSGLWLSECWTNEIVCYILLLLTINKKLKMEQKQRFFLVGSQRSQQVSCHLENSDIEVVLVDSLT